MTTFNVTNSNDSGAGSLREAVANANANPGHDDIHVQTDVTLTSAIKIADSVSIGTPHGATITQTGSDRIFTIDDGLDDDLEEENYLSNVSLSRLNLIGGNSDSSGGAILSYENLTIVDSELFNNTAEERGGAVYVEGASLSIERTEIYDNQIPLVENAPSSGSAIYVRDGELNLANSVVENNQSAVSSVVAFNSIGKINNTRISNNIGGGVGVVFGSDLEIVDSYINDNNASSTEPKNESTFGGGVYITADSTASLIDSTVINNSADFGGGLAVSENGGLEIVRSTVTGNTGTEAGGGIQVQYDSELRVNDAEISDNSAPYGGGIEITTDSVAVITYSAITGNTASESGGGIDTYEDSHLEVIDSIITGNSASFGGGIASYDGTSEVTLANTTLSNNSPNDFAGEGIDLLITGDDLDNYIDGAAYNDTLEGNGGSDTIIGAAGYDVLEGGAGFDTLEGNADNDKLRGGLGNDNLDGGDGNDTLIGGSNFDRLNGGNGDDVLIGNQGTDILNGGAGSDLFYLEDVKGRNWIQDFELGVDKIGLADGITYDALEITGNVNSFISYKGENLVVVLNVNPQDLSAENFREF